jgi:hypothetical protein
MAAGATASLQIKNPFFFFEVRELRTIFRFALTPTSWPLNFKEPMKKSAL